MNRRDFLKSALTITALGTVSRLAAQAGLAKPASVPAETNPGKVTRRSYKNTALTLPVLGFGMMRLPRKGNGIDYATAQKMVDMAMASGANYFDTAWPYHGGESETFVGKALRKYPRDSYLLASKLPIWAIKSEADAERIFKEQLRKCNTDYFDFYLLHALNGSRWKTVERFKLFEFAERMRKAGKIRKIGFSFHDSPEQLRTIAAAKPWDFALLQINYFDWYNYRSKEQYEIVTKLGIPILVMEPIRGGSLATLNPAATKILKTANPKASTASWALRYAASLPNVLCVLSGMSTPAHMEDNLRTMSPFRPLTATERMTLDSALAAYRKTDSVPCTVCEYCIPCPVGVEIPKVFAAYNQYKISGDRAALNKTLASLPEDGGPSACISCGVCLKKCPQKINIPARLKQIAAELKKS